jgi:predicted nucleic acid-binding protein
MSLVDSDVMIDILREHPPALAWLTSLGDAELDVPGFVVMELIHGCQNKAQQRRVERPLTAYDIVWPSQETCEEALALFARVHLSHKIGILDTLIGQLAVSLGEPLYTFNRKHYAAIPGLQLVQPYKR